jgi:3-dehydroquinate synthase
MLPDNILFSNQPGPDLQKFLERKKYSKLAVLTDDHTLSYCYPEIATHLPAHFTIEVKSGEEQKNLDTCVFIWQQLTQQALDRHAAVIVLGGGVLGDMGGFCAATYKRGIDFILIPTTLLSQVDASIGGKLGVDFDHYKNHIGVFQMPALTLLYSGFLTTLPYAELRSGFAEVIKHCLISDRSMWKNIIQHSLAEQDWTTLVKHSVAFKARITTEDPKEQGLRKILNAGHTIGHAVESFMLAEGKRILHGEAIAIGLIAESFIARHRGLLTSQELEEIKEYLITIYGKVSMSQQEIEEASLLTLQDKKNKDNRILCVLLNGIGSSRWDEAITIEEVKQGLEFYQSL